VNPDENYHSTDARGRRLGGGTLLQHSSQSSLWGRPLVRGDKHRQGRRNMGLPLLLGRGVRTERVGGQPWLL
jgi:hypothetical protein